MNVAICLNILLFVISLTLTGLGLFGKGWEDGQGFSLRRINKHGWTSVTCCVLAVVVVIAKELNTEAQTAEEESKVRNEQTELRATLNRYESRLKLQSRELEDQHSILAATKDHLNDVRNSLAATRDDLDQQTAATLLTALADTNQTIKDVFVLVPLTSSARRANDVRAALLPRFGRALCQDLTAVAVHIRLSSDHIEHFLYGPGHVGAGETYSKNSPIKRDSLEHYDDNDEDKEDFKAMKQLTAQRSSNGIIFSVGIRDLGKLTSAAELYSALSDPKAINFSISTIWPPIFDRADAYDTFAAKYGQVLKTGTLQFGEFGLRPILEPPPAYPQPCFAEVATYFRVAFDRAVYIIRLSQSQNETIIFRLRAETPYLGKEGWVLPFMKASAPLFRAFAPSSDPLAFDWTESTLGDTTKR